MNIRINRTHTSVIFATSSTNRRSAFTLVEILIALAIIGLLAAMALPIVARLRAKSQNTVFINDIRVLADAVQRYALENGSYPADSTASMPAEIAEYLYDEKYSGKTPLGGTWGWSQSELSIVVSDTTVTPTQMLQVDVSFDDGSLETGSFLSSAGSYFFRVK